MNAVDPRSAGRESHQKARAALEKLLATVDAGKITGEIYLRLSANQGGITKARIAIEGEVS